MVDKELQCLQDEGILELVEIADWAAPIVVVLKCNKTSVRIIMWSLYYTATVNPVSRLDRYPKPKINTF